MEPAIGSKDNIDHDALRTKLSKQAPKSPGGEKKTEVRRHMRRVIAKLQLPSGTLPTSTVPRPENKPGVTGSECERRMFGGVKETGMAFFFFLPLTEMVSQSSLETPKRCGPKFA